jgi:hypothetical protein
VEPTLNTTVTYEESGPAAEGLPSKDSRHAAWIGNWADFAKAGSPKLKDLSTQTHSYVEVELPAGHISAAFLCDTVDIPRARFLFGESPQERFFAHEAKVTLRYPAETTTFTLRSEPFDDRPGTDLVFRWGDKREFDILIGNGSFASLENVMKGSFCGQNHETLTDFEFEVLYDVVDCARDATGRLPVPRVSAREIRQIPCIITSIPAGTTGVDPAAPGSANARRTSFTGFDDRRSESALVFKDLNEATQIVEVPANINDLARAANHMCRILLDGRLLGTGFLVGSDRVMTAGHLFFNEDGSLIDPNRAAHVTVQFDRIDIDDGRVTRNGTAQSPLAEKWLVNPTVVNGKATREVIDLDYVIVRLARDLAGEQVGVVPRGHVEVPFSPDDVPLVREGVPVRILQHIDGGALRSSIGVVQSISTNGMRVGYTASTLDSASGSAVFDEEFRLLAIHVAGFDENFPRQNQGLPIRRVIEDLLESELEADVPETPAIA